MDEKTEDGRHPVPQQTRSPQATVAPTSYHSTEHLAKWEPAILTTIYALVQQVQLDQLSTAYPAVLVLGRATEQGPRAFADGKLLVDAQALETRLYSYLAMEQAGAIPYQYAVASVPQVPYVVTQAKAELASFCDYLDYNDTRRAASRSVV